VKAKRSLHEKFQSNFMRKQAHEKIKWIFTNAQDLLAGFWRFMQRLGHERRVGMSDRDKG
jgi:hypothetical protein